MAKVCATVSRESIDNLALCVTIVTAPCHYNCHSRPLYSIDLPVCQRWTLKWVPNTRKVTRVVICPCFRGGEMTFPNEFCTLSTFWRSCRNCSCCAPAGSLKWLRVCGRYVGEVSSMQAWLSCVYGSVTSIGCCNDCRVLARTGSPRALKFQFNRWHERFDKSKAPPLAPKISDHAWALWRSWCCVCFWMHEVVCLAIAVIPKAHHSKVHRLQPIWMTIFCRVCKYIIAAVNTSSLESFCFLDLRHRLDSCWSGYIRFRTRLIPFGSNTLQFPVSEHLIESLV